MLSCWHLALLLSLFWLLPATRTHAQDMRVQLTWQRPSASMCPSGEALEQDLATLLGRPVFTHDGDADVIIQGQIDEANDGARVHIEARSRTGALLGTRDLFSTTGGCAGLRKAIDLVLLTWIETTPTASDAAAPGQVSSQRAAARVGPSIALLTGTLPRATLGVGGALAKPLRARLFLRADAHYWLPVRVETSGRAGARFQALSLSLRLCPVLAGDALRLSLCAGAQIGALLGSPHGLRDNGARMRLLSQGLLELRAAQTWRGVGMLELGLGAFGSFTRPRFSYTDADDARRTLHKPAAMGAILSLALIIGTT